MHRLEPEFLSTLPARGATDQAVNRHLIKTGISIHAPREGSDVQQGNSALLVVISIHAPREGSDGGAAATRQQGKNFYPRSPRGERRLRPPPPFAPALNFYPRSPRGERRYVSDILGPEGAISIHAPREGSDVNSAAGSKSGSISIHAPREGSDLSLRSVGTLKPISIHAPREGSDMPPQFA